MFSFSFLWIWAVHADQGVDQSFLAAPKMLNKRAEEHLAYWLPIVANVSF